MTSGQIFAQAIAVVPALALTWVTIYVVYWILGIINWPRPVQWRLLDRWSTVEIPALGGFRVGSLMLISLISLFLELLLIRWVTSEIRVFAYFQSLVLVACFLGFGLGCYLTRARIQLAYTMVPLLALTLLIELPWNPLRQLITSLSSFIGWFSDVHIFSRAYFSGNPLWGIASAAVAMSIIIPLFGLVAVSFIPIGQLVGWYLENAPLGQGIRAYSLNVVASVVGIWAFTTLSFLSTPPVVWFACLGVALLLYFWPLPKIRITLFLSLALIVALFALSSRATRWWGEQSWKGATPAEYELTPGPTQTFWSPYQKLTLIPLTLGNETVRYILNTNDSWYQQILDLSAPAVAKHPELYPSVPIEYHQYNLPYQFYNNPPTVLIAGAGMGNDVAAALRNGAGHVTAVEIDPLIYAEGKQLHLEHPYDSPRVDVHIDDARSFVENAKDKYDLVVFSILDSQTTNSSYTNIRLDNYVYTLEAMEATRKLLKPDGLLVLSFSSERPWFAGHLRDVLARAFGKPPLMVQTNVTFFVVGPGNRVETALSANPRLKQFVDANSNIQTDDATLLTDDWPYLYMQYRGIPLVVWLLSLGLVGICWLTFNRLKGPSAGVQWHFFFLGAAFMLLEVQIISKLALLFGTTWLVNSIVITMLLLLILLSNVVVSIRPQLPGAIPYVGLFATVAFSYAIPTHALFFDSLFVRGLVASTLYCSPVFFAGLIFISSFRQIGFRADAFGSNLLGSLVGGLLQSLSFLIGIQALVVVAALLYLMSWVTKRPADVGVKIFAAASASD